MAEKITPGMPIYINKIDNYTNENNKERMDENYLNWLRKNGFGASTTAINCQFRLNRI